MSISKIAKKLRGGDCERLVKQTANEVTISGASVGVGNFKINIAKLSTKIKEFYKVTDIMVAMDNTQYLLCNQISRLNDNQPLKEDCIRIRLMVIMAYSQLQAIIGISKTEELRKELTKWVRYMNKLQKQAISSLKKAENPNLGKL